MLGWKREPRREGFYYEKSPHELFPGAFASFDCTEVGLLQVLLAPTLAPCSDRSQVMMLASEAVETFVQRVHPTVHP